MYAFQSLVLTFLQNISNVKSNPELHLPRPNEFLPEDFAVRRHTTQQTIHPHVFKDSDLIRLWYKKDDTFWVPKAYCWIQIKSPLVYASALNSILSKLYCELVSDALAEVSYYAECAGLSFELETTVEGIQVCFSACFPDY